jgi:hypothetical protein
MKTKQAKTLKELNEELFIKEVKKARQMHEKACLEREIAECTCSARLKGEGAIVL